MGLTELSGQARKNNPFGVGVADAQCGDTGLLQFESMMMFEFAGEVEVAAVGDDLTENATTGAGAYRGALDPAAPGSDETDNVGLQFLSYAFEQGVDGSGFGEVAETADA